MSTSINKVILVGNVGKDPEIRHTQNGNPVANFAIATSEIWLDKATGERKEKTEWHRVVIFGQLAKICQAYVKKGTRVYVEGQLQTRKWTDAGGNEKFSTEVVLQGFNCHLIMMGGARAADDDFSAGGRTAPIVPQRTRGNDPISTGRGPINDMDDDISF